MRLQEWTTYAGPFLNRIAGDITRYTRVGLRSEDNAGLQRQPLTQPLFWNPVTLSPQLSDRASPFGLQPAFHPANRAEAVRGLAGFLTGNCCAKSTGAGQTLGGKA